MLESEKNGSMLTGEKRSITSGLSHDLLDGPILNGREQAYLGSVAAAEGALLLHSALCIGLL